MGLAPGMRAAPPSIGGRAGQDRPVNGVWPLVRDAASPCGVRFLDLLADAPGSALGRVEDLPDVELAMRTFRSDEGLREWLAAADLLGGNAFAAEALEADGTWAVLYARLDRPARAAADLEGAIPLKGAGDNAHRREAAAFAGLREQASHAAVSRQRKAAWHAEWDSTAAAFAAATSGAIVPLRDVAGGIPPGWTPSC